MTPEEFTGSDSGELIGEVVPFGKYKGRPVGELVADDGYRDWVLAQPWVRERYGNFYQILVQGAPVPQDSPEHNEMQAKFLDEGWCTRLACCYPEIGRGGGLTEALDQVDAWKSRRGNSETAQKYEIVPGTATGIDFEKQGWDVYFEYCSAGISQQWVCECGVVYDEPPDHWDQRTSLYYDDYRTQWDKDYNKPREPTKPAEPVKPTGSVRSAKPVNPPYSLYYPPEYPSSSPAYDQQQFSLYQQRLTEYEAALVRYPGRIAEYEKELAGYPELLAEYGRKKHYALDHRVHKNHFGPSRNSWRVAAELKPDLGDDYPVVLRQVKGFMTQRVPHGYGQYHGEPICDIAFVIARRAQFRLVTWEQVQQVYAASSITLIRESDI
jgi:hypothetical protein